MRRADSLGAGSVLIIGEDELRSGEAVLRDMKTKEQKPVRFDEIAQVLKR
jgi:histidyl-tRNA synthetase